MREVVRIEKLREIYCVMTFFFYNYYKRYDENVETEAILCLIVK